MPSLTMHGCDVRITNKAIEGGDTLQQISEQLDDIANAIITIELMLNNNPQYTKQIATAYKATQKIRDIIKGEINIQIGGIYE